MLYLYLVSFFAGLLLAVRLMFFGAERRRIPSPEALPLRRWEPAVVAFLASPLSAGITGDAIAVGGGVPGQIHY